MTTQKTLLALLEKIEQLEQNFTPTHNVLSLTMSESRFLKFNEKEIFKMPKTFRKQFRAQGCTAHIRKRTDGRYNCSYEIRYAKKPYDKHPISASGTTIEEAKARFIEKLNNYTFDDESAPTVPVTFDGFSVYWFENFYKRKVCAETYKKGMVRYNNLVKPRFGKLKLKEILPTAIQTLLDSLADRHRLEEDVHSMLNQIFACAVKHGVLTLNPVNMCFHQNKERQHGTLIEKNEEEQLLNTYANTPLQIVFAVMFYTGLRPNEYATAVIDGNFIRAKNSKRKNGKEEIKRIPITPMLRPYIDGLTVLPEVNLKTLDKRFKTVLPNHKLYDMRTTFQTRCSECGIPDNVIGIWMGNSIGKLKEAYTDFSNEYLLREAKKFKY